MEKYQAVKEQMTKFGWKEGQGLGKNEQGVKEAIKVSLKNNKNGLGLDPSEQFVFHWWDHVFNKVASSIKIEDADGEVIISKCQDAGEVKRISTKRPTNSCPTKELLYGRFVKSGTAIVGNEVIRTNSESSEDDCDKEQERDSSDFSNKNTLDKAFEMSGGRTAHAAARHGNTFSGKLKRLQEQESKVCPENMKSKNYYEYKSDIFSNTVEAELKQGKENNKIIKREIKGGQNFNGKIRVVHEMSLTPTKKGKQHTPNKLKMMLESSALSIGEPTAAGKLTLSSDRKTEQVDIKKKRKSSKNNDVLNKYSKGKSDSKAFKKRKKKKKNRIVQMASGEAKIAKRKKTKKKKVKYNGDEEC